ncbi:MAG: hypothetical protein QNJ65_08075 [Xenococcaceae cyanobacterium MO_234.B1]|nr:hypothetical protein [Xenococcaceae cyanobacterium MO_234.B1]
MGEYLKKLTVATAISLLSLGTVEANKAHGAALFIGKYGSWLNSRGFADSFQKRTLPTSTVTSSSSELDNSTSVQSSASKSSIDSGLDNSISAQSSTLEENIDSATINDLLNQQLEQKLDSLPKAEKLTQQIQDYYQVFLDDPNAAQQDLQQATSTLRNELNNFKNADEINQDIRDRYQGVVEPETEQLSLLAARKLLLSTDNELGAEFNSSAVDMAQMQETMAFLQSQGWIEEIPTQQKETIRFPLPLTVGIFLLIAWRAYYIVVPFLKALGYSIDQGIGEELREKYGSPKVPDNAISLHDRTFKQLRSLAYKAEKIASEKFGSEEFMLYVRLKQQVEQGIGEYKTIGESIKLLEVAIAAQSSFLKIESTELRFRSRKQQEFYSFVADNLEDNIDKDEFRNKIKRKLAEIIPLLNSEEGRAALQSYLKEVNQISQHSLGLKLLALFKKYQLADFTILRTISEIVKQLEARDLLAYKSLVVLILEHLEVFEKLAPIIGISEQENSPETYAKMMQYMGLVHRHETAYHDFARLIKILKQWQKPYKSLLAIRNEYTADKYRLPPEFTKDIPGIAIFKKYEKHLESVK